MSKSGEVRGNLLFCAPFRRMPDALLNQANPVSTTWYTVLAATPNVRIISIASYLTWAVNPPNPLEIRVTIDGNVIIHTQVDPASNVNYLPIIVPTDVAANQNCTTVALDATSKAWIYEGRSIMVEVRITWPITQPNPLVCRVKYERM